MVAQQTLNLWVLGSSPRRSNFMNKIGNPMKKLKLLSITLLMLTTLSGCFVLQDEADVAPMTLQTELMTTRSHLRASNVGVEVDLFTELFGGRFERTAGNSQGSGVIYAEDDRYYYALTNYHVINPSDFDRVEYRVVPSYLEVEIDAEVIAVSEAYDLAVLRFLKPEEPLDVIDIFNRLDHPLEAYEMVLAVGNPSAVNSIVTYGEFIDHVEIADVTFDVILHSALIYPGNSGGALADTQGNLIGLNTWRSSGSDERNLSIPLEDIHTFLLMEEVMFGSDE